MMDKNTDDNMSGTGEGINRAQSQDPKRPVGDLPPRVPTLWNYRWMITAGAGIGLGLAIVIYLLLPKHRFTSLEFRVLFDGADRGEYPSGMKFAYNDIIARGILRGAYEANGLEKYGKFSDFQRTFFVAANPSPEIAALDSEYSSKLADRKLTAVDRAILESKYKERRSGLLRGVNHALNMDLSQGFAGSIPETLREKILRNILAAWAKDAALRKGAMKYQATILTKNILPEKILTEKPLIAADMLRAKLVKILASIDDLLEFPGARSFRTLDKGLSLEEIQHNLSEILHVKLRPTVELICRSGLIEDDKEAITTYVDIALRQAKLSKEMADERVKAMQDALSAYEKTQQTGPGVATGIPTGTVGPGEVGTNVSAVIPQFGASFLDRIVEMALKNNDMKFRQDFTERITTAAMDGILLNEEIKIYSDMQEAISSHDKGGAKMSDQDYEKTSRVIDERIRETYRELLDKTAEIEKIHNELSERNLNPQTELYSAREPIWTRTERTIGIRRMIMYGLMLTVGMGLVAAAGCSIHAKVNIFSGRSTPAPTPRSPSGNSSAKM